MRKIVSVILTLLMLGSMFAHGGKRQTNDTEVATPPKELIDIKADIVYPHKLGPDSSVLCLVGNFAAQHNGAIITADSAVRYSDDRIECFGNVLINKNTTYAYADRADYNGLINQITLFSPIIKVIDEDITLYTYNFKFNTLDNIGEYFGGGVTTNRDSNRLESLRGYYYADTKDVVGVEAVEIHTKEYDLKGDSVKYNMESDYAEFFYNTNIWNIDGDYLYANEGNYDKSLARFYVTRDGYILTVEQEVWSDSLEYFTDRKEVVLRGNIQMDDTTQKMLIYSDFAQYWDDTDKIFLTKNPSVVNYDPEQADSTFMRADTIIVTTHNREADLRQARIDSLRKIQLTAAKDSLGGDVLMDSIPPMGNNEQLRGGREGEVESRDRGDGPERGDNERGPAPGGRDGGREGGPDRGGRERGETHHNQGGDNSNSPDGYDNERASLDTDSLSVDTLAQDSVIVLTAKEIKAQLRDSLRYVKSEKKRKAAEAASLERIRQRSEKLDAQKAREARIAAQRRAKVEAKLLKRGKTPEDIIDILGEVEDSTTTLTPVVDSLPIDSIATESGVLDSVEIIKEDSIYRILVGYRNARSYKPNVQSLSDSLYGDSRDSTLHLYKNPLVWNGSSQISSEYMDIYTKNGEITHAVFTGQPITASMIDTTYYNQVTGRVMTSYFVDNELVRNDVEGNVRTIYFAQDSQSEEVTTMAYIESGSATFFFEDSDLTGITYRSKPEYIFYPVLLIPQTQSMRLEGFKWQGGLRPKRSDFLDRQRRPSIRIEKEALERPEFPIETNLQIDIENLTKSRKWMDRGELVDPQAEEWLESLGYKSGQPREESTF